MVVGPLSPVTAVRTSRLASVMTGGVCACAALDGTPSDANKTPSTTA
jgi:hypothetical protein